MALYTTIFIFRLIAENGGCYDDERTLVNVSRDERREALEKGARRRSAVMFLFGLASLLVGATFFLILVAVRLSLATNRAIPTRDMIIYCIPAMIGLALFIVTILEWLFMQDGLLDSIIPIKKRRAYSSSAGALSPASHLVGAPVSVHLAPDAFDRK